MCSPQKMWTDRKVQQARAAAVLLGPSSWKTPWGSQDFIWTWTRFNEETLANWILMKLTTADWDVPEKVRRDGAWCCNNAWKPVACQSLNGIVTQVYKHSRPLSHLGGAFRKMFRPTYTFSLVSTCMYDVCICVHALFVCVCGSSLLVSLIIYVDLKKQIRRRNLTDAVIMSTRGSASLFKDPRHPLCTFWRPDGRVAEVCTLAGVPCLDQDPWVSLCQ